MIANIAPAKFFQKDGNDFWLVVICRRRCVDFTTAEEQDEQVKFKFLVLKVFHRHSAFV